MNINKIPNILDSKYDFFIQSCSKETVVRSINRYIAGLDINLDKWEFNVSLQCYLVPCTNPNYKKYKWPEEYKDLSNLNLDGIWFVNTDLSGVDFSNSNLNYSNIINCNFDSANLSHTKLLSASFSYTNFSNADFTEADILLKENKDNIYCNSKWTTKCPESGSFVGYKMAHSNYKDRCFDNMCLIKLEIPEDAKRLSPYYSNKCRCDKAKVLEIASIIDPGKHYDIAYSDYTPDFEYRVGEIVSVDEFDDNELNECSSGIHFFMTKEDVYSYIVK